MKDIIHVILTFTVLPYLCLWDVFRSWAWKKFGYIEPVDSLTVVLSLSVIAAHVLVGAAGAFVYYVFSTTPHEHH